MANPIQQGLKLLFSRLVSGDLDKAAMANPIQQGLKHDRPVGKAINVKPQWLIQYNKD